MMDKQSYVYVEYCAGTRPVRPFKRDMRPLIGVAIFFGLCALLVWALTG